MSARRKKTGRLIGVGVGPGAPDLMTLRARRVLREADVIAIPRKSSESESLAWRIAAPAMGRRRRPEKLFLDFPMSRDPGILKAAHRAACRAIQERTSKGKTVAFICLGDPLFYGTFGYIATEFAKIAPSVPIEVVPGVSAVMAVPAAAGIVPVDGKERAAILPSFRNGRDLEKTLEDFDTVFIMKCARRRDEIARVLEKMGLADSAVTVSRATLQEEEVFPGIPDGEKEGSDYFSMTVVTKKNRKWKVGR